MLYQVDDALLHAMSGIERSRVRTQLRLLLPETYQQKSDRVERRRHCHAIKYFCAEFHLFDEGINRGLAASESSFT